MQLNQKPQAEIKDWFIYYQENQPHLLFGMCTKHPKIFSDKGPMFVRTSKIEDVNLDKGIVETQNTIFKLTGEPLQKGSETYEKAKELGYDSYISGGTGIG